MLRLDTTTRKLQAALAGAVTANQLPITVCYSDKTATAYTGGTTVINTNSATAVDICAAPAASTIRDIDTINIQNADTAAATITIRYNDNGATYTLFKAVLAVGDQLTYVHGDGWKVCDANGALKNLASDVVTLTGTQTLTNKTLTSPDINGGTIDGAVIGGATPAAGSFTTLGATGNVTLGDATTDTVTFAGIALHYAGAAATPSIAATGDANTGIWFPAADTIAASTGGTERLRIDSAGNSKFSANISVGGATVATSGTGITFPATQSASSDANTLDDYEEGTFTPTFSNDAGDLAAGTSLSFNAAGQYTKIGNVVTFRIITATAGTVTGTASSPVRVALPVAATAAVAAISFNATNDDSASYTACVTRPTSAQVEASEAFARLKKSGAGAQEVNFLTSDLAAAGNANRIVITGHYAV